MVNNNNPSSDIILYNTPDGHIRVEVMYAGETFWLTQKRMAELFGVEVPAISKHLSNIFESGELSLIDELGKIVITKNVIKGDLSEILTDQLVQGFYVMQIKNDQGVYQSKLLKSN